MTQRIALWWRDDDAVEDTPALRRLLAIKQRWNVPLALAVIPSKAQPSIEHVTCEPDLEVLVHGFAHENHASPDERKAEYPSGRSLAEMRREWISGHDILRRHIPSLLRVFVPPWNRFPQDHLLELKSAGYRGFSAWGAEGKWPETAGLIVANAQIDALDWQRGAVAKTGQSLLAELQTLALSGRHSLTRPIGILTHHRQMSETGFTAFEEFCRVTAHNPAFVWTSARSIFCGPE